ncbi:NRAMP family divalent metal transporter [Sphingomonas sp. URHD0057]|uniref:NRAMP family divalent metal transporter n=1 Tax=Sphingomonas sp. URHD0057 TaxID=1380389 RepID=UPI00048F55A9|nr:divalent metal cation transporter [Sphingomonas sp. URHD0057]
MGWGLHQARARLGKSLHELGPGIVTGAADDDPSGIATYSQAGAQFGYGLLWTLVLTYPLMSAVQLVSAHIGRVTGCGLARNLRGAFPGWIVTLLVAILLAANIFNIGADLAAMAASAALVTGGGEHVFVIAFALLCVGLQLFVPYRQYAEILKWLTLSLFAYVAVILLVHVDWPQALLGMVWPRNLGRAAILTVVAVLGTTISPYLFFWQSSQEAEDVATSSDKPLKASPRSAPEQYRRIRLDTLVGMAFSNLIALAIMLATAATLHARGVTDIQTAADAALALKPIAGRFAFVLFAMGIIGTGILAVPVLAGSAAFAVSEARGWPEGLEYKPQQAMRFYAIIVAATLTGVVLEFSSLDPIKALFWSAVLNGVAAVPIMAAMMVLASRKAVMGRFTERRGLLGFGWAATAVMALASGAMLVTSFAG